MCPANKTLLPRGTRKIIIGHTAIDRAREGWGCVREGVAKLVAYHTISKLDIPFEAAIQLVECRPLCIVSMFVQ